MGTVLKLVLAAAAAMIAAGQVRVHDVRSTVRAVRIADQILRGSGPAM